MYNFTFYVNLCDGCFFTFMKQHFIYIPKPSPNIENSIQFNSKTLFKDGDPVSSQLIFPGAIQTWE